MLSNRSIVCRKLYAAVIMALASGTGACTDDETGKIAVSWTIVAGGRDVPCDAVQVRNVRVDAIDFETGEVTPGGTRPCSASGLQFEVPGGAYLLTIDALDARNALRGHDELLTVAAVGGLTTASLVVGVASTQGDGGGGSAE